VKVGSSRNFGFFLCKMGSHSCPSLREDSGVKLQGLGEGRIAIGSQGFAQTGAEWAGAPSLISRMATFGKKPFPARAGSPRPAPLRAFPEALVRALCGGGSCLRRCAWPQARVLPGRARGVGAGSPRSQGARPRWEGPASGFGGHRLPCRAASGLCFEWQPAG
jgi:hypothetical protein